MTDHELRELAASVEDLKRAVKKNDPFLRGMMSTRGWMPLTLIAAIGITLFCLPAQVLVVAYGDFASIPAMFRTALWCVLALVLVLSAVWKVLLLSRKASEVEKDAGLGAVMKALFAGPSFHIGVPFVIVIVAVSCFALRSGHPWYVAPAIAIPTCFWSNYVASQVAQPAFRAAGWWCLLTGVASLFFLEQAPFIWLFVIFGGVCLVFAGVLLFIDRKEKVAGR